MMIQCSKMSHLTFASKVEALAMDSWIASIGQCFKQSCSAYSFELKLASESQKSIILVFMEVFGKNFAIFFLEFKYQYYNQYRLLIQLKESYQRNKKIIFLFGYFIEVNHTFSLPSMTHLCSQHHLLLSNLLIIQMQKIISQIPELAAYLSRIPKSNHFLAIRQIIQLGLRAIQPICCRDKQPNDALAQEIDRIKENLNELNQVVKQQCHHCCHQAHSKRETHPSEQRQFQSNYHQQTLEENNSKTFSFKQQKDQKGRFQPPVREAAGVLTTDLDNRATLSPFSKNKGVISKHHLDDRQAREALTFPPSLLVEASYPLKRKSKEYKKHIYQEQINNEELKKLKETAEQYEERHEHEFRGRSVTDYHKATSKIKNLLDKDRIRYHQKQRDESFKEGFNKYEYSDENQMEESSIPQEPPKESSKSNRLNYEDNTSNQHFHSSFKVSNPASSSQKASSKKEFERSKKEVSSKLQASNEHKSRNPMHHSESSQGEASQRQTSERQSRQNEIEEEEDDVISNSSSFSQFSINGSQKRSVGKISRKIVN